MGYGRFIGRIGSLAETGELDEVMDHKGNRNKSECVEKCFSCFRDVKFGVTGQRRHVPAVHPVTVRSKLRKYCISAAFSSFPSRVPLVLLLSSSSSLLFPHVFYVFFSTFSLVSSSQQPWPP